MRRARILVVDDEPDMLEVCEDTLRSMDADVEVESKSAVAARRLERETWDLALLDLKMPAPDGIELLRIARRVSPDTVVCILTAFPTIETAVEALKLGAYDYITKPFSPDQLRAVAERALERKFLKEQNLFLSRHVEQSYKFDDIIGKSPAMSKIFEIIQQVAATDSDVFVLGESGTGKELVARSIHARSKRKGERFVPVDCGAIPDNLLESEFFGHEKGAFTGATFSRMGLFEFADKGTFFLDEICELSLRLQAKLLRVLQDHSFRRVGGTEEIKIHVRVIAATNRDVDLELKEKRFREDLFYRINVVRITIPPLRERVEDIPLLVKHYLDRYSREYEKPVTGISEQCMEVLLNYSWPGNVRELQNVLKQAITLTRNESIGLEDLPDALREESRGVSVSAAGFFDERARKIETFEQDYLRDMLSKYRGDTNQMAEAAGLPRGTLYRLIKKYGFKPKDFRG